MCSLKIHDNVLFDWVSNEWEHDSLSVSKVQPVNKIHAQSCKKMLAKGKSSNFNNKAPERRQSYFGAQLHIKQNLF